VFDVPGIRPLARRIYAWIAKNRMRLTCAPGVETSRTSSR
jgi:predicted DCC family thiol-disulfide oxidoreductase YuxK